MMYDMLPFLSITTRTPTEQIAEVAAYLIRLKETLEFLLANISTDNLAPELLDKLNRLGEDMEESEQRQEDTMTQFAGKMLTVADVVNSEAFVKALEREYRFCVNFETGNLEYEKGR